MKTYPHLKSLTRRSLFFIFMMMVQACEAQDKKNENDIGEMQKNSSSNNSKISYSGIVDFRYAAKVATPGVVNVKCSFKTQPQQMQSRDDSEFYDLPAPLRDFFKDHPLFRQYDSQPIVGSASGVILTADGYIVTNNHVVKSAEEINITLFDGRSYPAKVVGSDPQTDLALLKINEKGLSFISFGESDTIEVGEWVVAVGNPFNLASTVTAGIVSAKARNINILSDQGAIESFIQTDAAVNPGNSGGALVTLEGKLIGINTAIATPTGTYTGYAFAIPVDIVKKVTNDLMNFGYVQRGILGISIRDLNSTIAKEININRANGVYVDSVLTNGAAKEAGVRNKDVIISIDGIETVTASKLQEVVMRKRPGEKVKITLIRNGKDKKEFIATLKKYEETPRVTTKQNVDLLKDLGIEIAEISKEDQKIYNVKSGIKITKLTEGKLKSFTDIREGFVITSVNRRPVYTVRSFIEAVSAQPGGIMLEGKYAGDPTYYYYAFGM